MENTLQNCLSTSKVAQIHFPMPGLAETAAIFAQNVIKGCKRFDVETSQGRESIHQAGRKLYDTYRHCADFLGEYVHFRNTSPHAESINGETQLTIKSVYEALLMWSNRQSAMVMESTLYSGHPLTFNYEPFIDHYTYVTDWPMKHKFIDEAYGLLRREGKINV